VGPASRCRATGAMADGGGAGGQGGDEAGIGHLSGTGSARALGHHPSFVSVKPSSKQEDDGLSTVLTVDEAALSNEQQLKQLQIIKARTMYEMVEEDGARKILFLTNEQADQLSGSRAALERMLDALEIPREGPGAPQLVINMMQSQGLANQLNDHWRKETATGPPKGRRRVKAPFLSDEDERCASQRLDNFMSDVILPLAARTNAIVMVNAFTCNCFLAHSFQRMVALQKMKWGGKLPFWVVAMTSQIQAIYGNTNPDAEWRKIKSQCRAWRLREPKIYEAFHHSGYHDPAWGVG